jgi:hypothetical protein
MSDTRKDKREFYTKHRIRNRANIYGMCVCASCRAGRSGGSSTVEKIKRKWKKDWKSNRPFVKGAYTD